MLHLLLTVVYIGGLVLSLNEEQFEALYNLHHEICPSKHSSCNISVESVVDSTDDAIQTDTGTSLCCGYCQCDQSCVIHGSCCPSSYKSSSHARQVMESSRFGCVTPKYIIDKTKTDFRGATYTDPVWMINRCKPEISSLIDSRITRLCENPGENGSLQSLVPVTDKNLHYRNVYCSLCNGLSMSDVSYWKIEVYCSIVIAHIDANILDKIAKEKCNIFYVSPESVKTEECDLPEYSISECNKTGLWAEYNETIQHACDLFVDPFNLTYKNYFCFLCNNPDPGPPDDWKCYKTENVAGLTPPFTAIFDLGYTKIETDEVLPRCDVLTQFRDTKTEMCRNISCHDDRHLNGLQCQLKTNFTIAKCYQFFVKLTRIAGAVVDSTFVNTHSFLLSSNLSEFMFSIYNTLADVHGFRIYANPVHSQHAYIVTEILLQARVTKQDDILAHLAHRVHGKIFKFAGVTFVTEIAIYSKTEDDQRKIYVTGYNNSARSESFLITMRSFQNLTTKAICVSQDFALFNKIHVCPFIQIGLGEWSIKIEDEFLVVEEEFTQKRFSRWEYERHDGKISICLEDFKSIYGTLPSKSRTRAGVNDAIISPKQLLAFVCICLSITSLLVTIAFHLLYPELQSQPGINNIILCVCLLLAQSLYQFGAGQRSLSYWECSLIGAFCHFFWLTVMFSMNSCSVQMYIVFRHTFKLCPKFQWRRTIKYISYIILSSLTFVAINVFVSLIKSSGEKSGYGGRVCYVSSNVMLLITFILPAGVTIFANIGLFSYVIYRLHKTNIVSTKMNIERNHFRVYARLSTITGLTWLFGFIMLILKNDVLEYLFIIFNASQGIFIMIAFVINKRVFSLSCFSSKTHSSTNNRSAPDSTK